MNRFVKHADVQTLVLPQLGLSPIDFAAIGTHSGPQLVTDDDNDERQVAIADDNDEAPPIADVSASAPADARRGNWAASRASTNSSFTAIDVDGDGVDQNSAAAGSQPLQLVEADATRNTQLARFSPWGSGRMTLTALKSLTREDYLQMTPARAALVGAQASSALSKAMTQIAAAAAAKKQLNRKLSNEKARSAKMKVLQDQSQSHDSTLVLHTKPGSGKRLTAQASLALGIRKNLAHVAAADFGALLLQDISASTVLRAEVRTGAALAASMRDHVGNLMSALRVTDENCVQPDVVDAVDVSDIAYCESAWNLLFICVRADATNSSIWRREKLHVTEAHLGLVNKSVKSFPDSPDKFMSTRRCLQGPEFVGLREDSSLSSSRSIIVYLDTTDRGTDQLARRKRTAAAVESINQVVYIPSDCYLHVFHAAVRGGLELVDQLIAETFSRDTLKGFDRYYSSLAKIVNLWREKASDMMTAWQNEHSQADKDVRDLGRRYPLSVSTGRWGSVEGAEEFLLERGRKLVEPCMLQVLSRSMKADPSQGGGKTDTGVADEAAATAKPEDGNEAMGLDDLRENEAASYRIRLSKWCQGSMNAITSCIFWCLLYLCRTLRSPLRHFMLIVQKEARGGECMFKLITSKLQQLINEFQNLFRKLPAIVSQALQLSGCLDPVSGLADREIQHMRYVALRLLLMHWAAFRRRIVRPLQQFPWQLFWLIKDPPRQFSQKRKDVAAKFLNIDPNQLDPSTRKLRVICEREVQHMKEHGVFPNVPCASGSFMFAFLKGLAKMQPVDTQAIEGINSVIKLVGRRCPNISLELMSARLAVRRSLSEDGSMRRCKKWSKIRHTAEGLLATVAGYHTAALAIMNGDSRWSVPLPVELVHDDDRQAVLAITDKQAVACVRADCVSPGTSTVPALVPDDTADATEVGTGRGSSSIGCRSEGVAAATVNSVMETETAGDSSFFESLTSQEVVVWAKSYNLGWRRATNGLHGKVPTKKSKLSADNANGDKDRGMLLAVFQPDTMDEVQHRSQKLPHVFAVAEKFSVSVMFTKLDIVQEHGQNYLTWNYSDHNCIESTLLMTTFHGACCGAGGSSFNVGCVVLRSERAQLLLRGLAMLGSGEMLSLESVLAESRHCFVMTAAPLPRPTKQKQHKPKAAKAKAKASRSKAKAKATATAASITEKPGVSKRKHTDDGADDQEGDDDNDDAGKLEQYLLDQNVCDEEEYRTSSDESDELDSADLAAAEIKKACSHTASSSSGSAGQMLSVHAVHDLANELQQRAELAPPGDVEEEALLLLVRRARSEKNKELGAGCSRRKPHHVTGQPSRSVLDTQPGVMDASIVAETSGSDAGSERDTDDDNNSSDLPEELANVLGVQSIVEMGRPGRVLVMWAVSCHHMLVAMSEFAKFKDISPGHERSISLVLLAGQDPIPGCKCVRCKFQDTSQEVMWVHWVYNTNKLLGEIRCQLSSFLNVPPFC
ncbi:unnamed protein product [Symbiodinium natans]|uniref:Uncharacterized protein n=1 Tax=Symbiodinium natans TaxID=878477 RepID=A0A812SS07_9DINO|nr:unnamed protein product [Symbiodinium natans]